MIVGTGIDIIDVRRVAETLANYGEQFERKIFTETEIAYCKRNPKRAAERFAARFAAKEAFSKALGTGMARGIYWTDIGVTREPSGRPALALTGEAARRCAGLQAHLSLSHTDDMAMAMVILERIG